MTIILTVILTVILTLILTVYLDRNFYCNFYGYFDCNFNRNFDRIFDSNFLAGGATIRIRRCLLYAGFFYIEFINFKMTGLSQVSKNPTKYLDNNLLSAY